MFKKFSLFITGVNPESLKYEIFAEDEKLMARVLFGNGLENSVDRTFEIEDREAFLEKLMALGLLDWQECYWADQPGRASFFVSLETDEKSMSSTLLGNFPEAFQTLLGLLQDECPDFNLQNAIQKIYF